MPPEIEHIEAVVVSMLISTIRPEEEVADGVYIAPADGLVGELEVTVMD